MRKDPFVNDEYYHIFHHGIETRHIFSDIHDISRFFESMNAFNSVTPAGSIQELRKIKKENKEQRKKEPLVEIVAYCFNHNHFHILLRQTHEGGISEYMRRFLAGYTKYFNEKHKRKGPLFRGTFQAKLIQSDEQLLRVFVYVSRNNEIHQQSLLVRPNTSNIDTNSFLSKSSFRDASFVVPEIVTSHFSSTREYIDFVEEAFLDIVEKKKNDYREEYEFEE